MWVASTEETKLTESVILDFLSDGRPHRLRDLPQYLAENNIENIGRNLYNNVICRMKDSGRVKCISRGVYVIETDWEFKRYGCKEDNIKPIIQILRNAQRELARPISVISLGENEKKFISDIQGLYMECEKLIQKMEGSKEVEGSEEVEGT